MKVNSPPSVSQLSVELREALGLQVPPVVSYYDGEVTVKFDKKDAVPTIPEIQAIVKVHKPDPKKMKEDWENRLEELLTKEGTEPLTKKEEDEVAKLFRTKERAKIRRKDGL